LGVILVRRFLHTAPAEVAATAAAVAGEGTQWSWQHNQGFSPKENNDSAIQGVLVLIRRTTAGKG